MMRLFNPIHNLEEKEKKGDSEDSGCWAIPGRVYTYLLYKNLITNYFVKEGTHQFLMRGRVCAPLISVSDFYHLSIY